jgi:hypothetical protein
MARAAEYPLAESAEWLYSGALRSVSGVHLDTVQACDVVCVETTRTNSNARVEAVHELRKIREDYVIGIIGRPLVRSPGFVGQWMRVFSTTPTGAN